MTRKEYMEQLKKYLKRLPKEDYDNAMVQDAYGPDMILKIQIPAR